MFFYFNIYHISNASIVYLNCKEIVFTTIMTVILIETCSVTFSTASEASFNTF